MPESVQKLRDHMASADGLFISAPEFNWTISAPLKNMIDWVSRFPAGQQPFFQKPVAILSATMGPLGGARVQYDLRRSLSGLGCWIWSSQRFSSTTRTPNLMPLAN
jgi:chromate reductase, NAD(P)H dehydrogenase (quinone)